jgi:hypothetical protein
MRESGVKPLSCPVLPPNPVVQSAGVQESSSNELPLGGFVVTYNSPVTEGDLLVAVFTAPFVSGSGTSGAGAAEVLSYGAFSATWTEAPLGECYGVYWCVIFFYQKATSTGPETVEFWGNDAADPSYGFILELKGATASGLVYSDTPSNQGTTEEPSVSSFTPPASSVVIAGIYVLGSGSVTLTQDPAGVDGNYWASLGASSWGGGTEYYPAAWPSGTSTTAWWTTNTLVNYVEVAYAFPT